MLISMKQMSGARILVHSLIRNGVDTLFGIPGGAVLAVYDELYKARGHIRHVLTAHEQGAAHAADGYARASGRTGVCIATSGPGASNLVTGIAAAYMDSVPMVVVTGNVASTQLGTDSFQEVDIAGMTAPITKYGWIVTRASDIARTVDEAFALARSGRPGPVLVDVTRDAFAEKTACDSDEPPACPAAPPSAPKEDIASAASLINASERPLILAGGGVRADAAARLRALAEKLRAPVSTTLMGAGALPHGHPLLLGAIGMHGERASNIASTKCDLLLAVGTRFADRILGNASAFMPEAKVIHIDIDRAELNKNIAAHTRIVSDADDALSRLLPLVRARQSGAWASEMRALRVEPLEDAHAFHPSRVMRALKDALGDGALIATDVGQHQMWAARHYPFDRPKQLITSGGLGAMGFGLGAAIGAKLARPECRVALVTGDGSFRMNLIELATVAAQKLPLVILVMNNGALGMIRQLQTVSHGARYAHSTLAGSPDFPALARAYGLAGESAADMQQLVRALEGALSRKTATVIDVRVDIDEQVRPMVEAGRPIDKFALE